MTKKVSIMTKERFDLAKATHDMQNLLTPIIAYSEMLATDATPEQRKMVRIIVQNARKLSVSIQELDRKRGV